MPHGTTPVAVTTNKNIIMSSFKSSRDIQKMSSFKSSRDIQKVPLTILAGSKAIMLVHTQFAQYQLGLLQFIQVETKAFTT